MDWKHAHRGVVVLVVGVESACSGKEVTFFDHYRCCSLEQLNKSSKVLRLWMKVGWLINT